MASLSNLPDNFWAHYTGFRQASPEIFKELRLLRGVSKTMKGTVDRRLVDEGEWKQFFSIQAAEFCDDLAPGAVLPPLSQAGNGLRRMLLDEKGQSSHRPFRELLAGCRTFLYDATTQQRILTEFRKYLNSSQDSDFLAPRINHIENASNAPVHAAIINILRVHGGNVRIAQDACAIHATHIHAVTCKHAPAQCTCMHTHAAHARMHPHNAHTCVRTRTREHACTCARTRVNTRLHILAAR